MSSTLGHVGPPLPCNLVKLVDVAEMNYLAVNGEGEVCVLWCYHLSFVFFIFFGDFCMFVSTVKHCVWVLGVCEGAQCI